VYYEPFARPDDEQYAGEPIVYRFRYRFDLPTLNAIVTLDNRAGYIYFMHVIPIPPETVELQTIE
jgi:hypothetical protein